MLIIGAVVERVKSEKGRNHKDGCSCHNCSVTLMIFQWLMFRRVCAQWIRFDVKITGMSSQSLWHQKLFFRLNYVNDIATHTGSNPKNCKEVHVSSSIYICKHLLLSWILRCFGNFFLLLLCFVHVIIISMDIQWTKNKWNLLKSA